MGTRGFCVGEIRVPFRKLCRGVLGRLCFFLCLNNKGAKTVEGQSGKELGGMAGLSTAFQSLQHEK